MTPRTPRGRVSCENPRECHPPPSPKSTAIPGAGRSHRLPAAAAARPRRSLLPFAKGQRGSAGLGGTLFPSAGAPLEGSPGKKGRGCSRQTFTRSLPSNLPQPGCTLVRTARVQGEAPADLPFGLLLSCRKFLQSHIATAGPPQRESGVRAAPATVCTRAPALCTPSRASPAPAAAAAAAAERSAPLAPLAFGPLASPRQASQKPRHQHRSCHTATEGQRPRSPELSCLPPANHLPPHLHTLIHWAMQISLLRQFDPSSWNKG